MREYGDAPSLAVLILAIHRASKKSSCVHHKVVIAKRLIREFVSELGGM
jgi:hypothetical protein